MTKERNSNIELLRILSMLMIVFHHFSAHGNFLYSGTDADVLYLYFIQMWGKIGVVVFMLISGYFLVSVQTIRTSKIIKLWLQAVFYSLTIYIMAVGLNLTNFSVVEFAQTFLPFSSNLWWFATAYFVLYLLSPFINKLLNGISQKSFIGLLLIETFLWGILGMISRNGFQSNEFISLTYFYTIGAYIKLYKNDVKLSKGKNILYLVIVVVVTYSARVGLELLGTKTALFAQYAPLVYDYRSPFAIAVAVLLFYLFKNINLSNIKLINIISSATFGVYLIHDSNYIRPLIWKTIFHVNDYQNASYFIPYSIGVCLAVYAACTLVELLRIYILEKNYMKLVYRSEAKLNKAVNKVLAPIYKIMQ